MADLPQAETQPGRRPPPITAHPARGRGLHADRAPGRSRPEGADFPSHRHGPGQRPARPPPWTRRVPATNMQGNAGLAGRSTTPARNAPFRDLCLPRPATRRLCGEVLQRTGTSGPGRSAKPWCLRTIGRPGGYPIPGDWGVRGQPLRTLARHGQPVSSGRTAAPPGIPDQLPGIRGPRRAGSRSG